MNPTRNILAVLLVILAFTGGAFFMVQSMQSGRTQPAFATVWPSPKPLAEFNLVDHRGETFTKSEFEGRWSLVFFGFTHCPDICPATLQQLAIANNKMTENGIDVPDIFLVSVDPERDSPDTMADYVGHFGGEINGITGDLDEIMKLTSSAGVYFAKSELPDDDYTVDHSVVVLVIDDTAAIHASFSGPHNIDNFVNDMPILMGSN